MLRRTPWIMAALLPLLASCGGANLPGDLGVVIPPRDVAGEGADVPAAPDVPRDADSDEPADATPFDVPGDEAKPDPGLVDPGPVDPGTSDPGAIDPGVVDPGVKDPGTSQDPGPADVLGGCDPCGYGTVAGTTCAPNTKTAMPYVRVWVDTTDCSGNPIHVETHSDGQGNYKLEGVPCGTQTVWMQKGSFQHVFTRWIDKGLTTVATSHDSCFEGTAAKIAVITGSWDAIQKTLVQLWFHFTLVDGLMDDGDSQPDGAKLLANPDKLNEYDVIFINCGSSPDVILENWGDEIRPSLQQFVQKGGSVYMSDWASVYFTDAWPNAWNGQLIRDFPGGMGSPLKIMADVVDTDLAGYLKKTQAEIDFGLSPLTSIVGTPGPDTKVHIQGRNPSHDNDVEPFMISFQPYGPTGGRVVYTNFHNDEQSPTGDMADILQYVVFLM